MGEAEEYPPVLSEAGPAGEPSGKRRWLEANDPSQALMRTRYAIVVMFLSLALVGVGNLIYTINVNHKSDHQWCDILKIAGRPLPQGPPPTADQIKGRLALRKLAKDKGCIK